MQHRQLPDGWDKDLPAFQARTNDLNAGPGLYLAGEAMLAVERQYYASHDYNSMLQAIAGLPSKEGTFCFYIGRVSTDQVAGVTSPALHPLSRVIAAPYIKDMFERLQAKAKKQ